MCTSGVLVKPNAAGRLAKGEQVRGTSLELLVASLPVFPVDDAARKTKRVRAGGFWTRRKHLHT